MAVAVPVVADVASNVYFTVPPPAARQEAVPAARRGYLWVPGYWNDRGHRHVWRTGQWQRNRNGYTYVQPSWAQHDNGWHLKRGGWQRGDRNHDGVPNNRDRAPNNPLRQ